jgi:CRP/FNR family cyclic AMP-dependent transcriptional regulator
MTPAMVGKILEEHAEGNNRLGLIEFGEGSETRRRTIYLNLVPNAHAGDLVRFRAGFATERVKEEALKRVRTPSGPGGGEAVASVPAKEPDLETYEAYRLLSELDPNQLRKLILLAQEKQFGAGEIIFQAGDQSLSLLLIVAGEVVLEDVSGGRPVHVQSLRAGDAMGWSALTDRARTHFRARAISRVSTLAFPGDEISAAFQRDPAMGYAFLKRLLEVVTERLDALRVRLVSQESHSES